MLLDRRQALLSLAATTAAAVARPLSAESFRTTDDVDTLSLHRANGEVDWKAVKELFPLDKEWLHFASFLFVSHPKPVALAIEQFRKKIDADPYWVEIAALTDQAGRPFHAVKRALADYIGGSPSEIAMTANTTTALAMAWHGLRIRADQEIVTTEHDHFSQHESIRYAAERAGCSVRRIALYDRPSEANAEQIAERVARAITPRTRAIGVTWVHSSTGVKLPLHMLADVVARANRGRTSADRCMLIVDGVHGFANQDVDVAKLGVDFFATGAHKWLFAPRGTGFLWGRSDAWSEMRPTIPTFDPVGGLDMWEAWMAGRDVGQIRAAHISPGGFVSYEYQLAIPAAVELHRTIGRQKIAARIAELNGMFREAAPRIKGLTLHTPRDPALSAGISCFEIAGYGPDAVTQKLAAKRIRTSNSPYKVSYARVAVGIMNTPAELDVVLRELRSLAA
jgi:selenocysteine lyase/cysteine desulfurase